MERPKQTTTGPVTGHEHGTFARTNLRRQRSSSVIRGGLLNPTTSRPELLPSHCARHRARLLILPQNSPSPHALQRPFKNVPFEPKVNLGDFMHQNATPCNTFSKIRLNARPYPPVVSERSESNELTPADPCISLPCLRKTRM